MIWIPLISISIFVVSFLAMTFIGYKKGWHYALLLSFILILVTLIFVGINFGIYKIGLWPLYKMLFLRNISHEVNVEVLSKYYRSSIIITSLLPEMILIYPLSFLIASVSFKPLKKFTGYKVSKISISKIKIISRIFIQRFKLMGAAILGITSIFSSSLLASSVNSLTIPYKKSNQINSIMDKLGEIYAFGLAKNDKSSQIITSFLKKNINNKIAQSIREILNFRLDKDQFTLPNINKIRALNSSRTKELFSSPNATKAIFDSIFPKKEGKINLFFLDKNTLISNKDENENEIGYNQRYNDYESKLSNYISKNSFDLKLQQEVKDFIVDNILELIIKFESTVFYKKFIKQVDITKKQNKQLQTRKSNLIKGKRKLPKYFRDRENVVQYLSKISGKNSRDFDRDSTSPYEFPIKSISESNTENSGAFYDLIQQRNELLSKRQDRHGVFDRAQKKYTDFVNNTYNPMIKQIADKKNELKKAEERRGVVSQSKLDELKKEYDKLQNKFKSIIKEDYKKLYEDQKSKNSQLKIAIDNLKAKNEEINKMKSQFEIQITKLDSLNNLITNVVKLIRTLEKVDPIFNNIVKTWNYEDDNSIYYAEQKLIYDKNKVEQLRKIKDIKKQIFDNKLKIFKMWIRKWVS